jgi:hypothetical protein
VTSKPAPEGRDDSTPEAAQEDSVVTDQHLADHLAAVDTVDDDERRPRRSPKKES